MRQMGALVAMVVVGAVLAPVAVADLQGIHDRLLSIFTHVDQAEDVPIRHSGDEPFAGDCDDYYTAAWTQMYRAGYEAYALISRVRGTGKLHIVACADVRGRRRCLDPNAPRVSGAADLEIRYYDFEVRRP